MLNPGLQRSFCRLGEVTCDGWQAWPTKRNTALSGKGDVKKEYGRCFTAHICQNTQDKLVSCLSTLTAAAPTLGVNAAVLSNISGYS